MADPNAQFNTTAQALNQQFDPQALARLLMQSQTGQALMAQGMGESPQGQMVSGHYVAPSPFQQLGKLASLLAGQKMATEGNAGVMQTNLANTRAMMGLNPDGSQGQAQGASAGGNDPYGMPNLVRGMVVNAVGGPEASKAYWANTAPTPTDYQKLIQARMGAPDGSPQAKFLDAQLQKLNYEKPVEIGQGNLAVDPFTRTPFAYNPKTEPGISPTFSFNGTSTVPTGAQQLPGYSQANADIQGAAQGAKAANSIINVTTPTGASVPVLAGPAAAAGSAQAGLPAPLANNNPGAMMPGGKLAQYPTMQAGLQAIDQNLASYGKQGVTTLAGVISKWAPPGTNNTQAYIQDVAQRLHLDPNQKIDLSNPAVRQAIGTGIMLHENGPGAVFGTRKPAQLGQSQTQKAMTDQGATMYHGAVNEAQNIQQFRQALNDMWQLSASGKFGPGTPQIARFKALLSNSGIDMSGAQTDQDVMKKLASFISSSQLGSAGGTGTDSQLNNLLAGLPHGDMTNEAMKKVIPLLVSQLDAKEARSKVAANYYQQNPSDLSGLPNAIAKYNQLADPGTVSAGVAMARASQQGPQALSQFDAQMSRQYGQKWPAIRAKIQQLDALGAF